GAAAGRGDRRDDPPPARVRSLDLRADGARRDPGLPLRAPDQRLRQPGGPLRPAEPPGGPALELGRRALLLDLEVGGLRRPGALPLLREGAGARGGPGPASE